MTKTIYPYGKELRQFNNGLVERYKSTNHERDIETNYDNRGARLSDCETVRFLSPDPLEDKFPSLSTYNYVGGNPIRFIDLDGRALDDYFRKSGYTLLVRH